jgi:hypothetical protein
MHEGLAADVRSRVESAWRAAEPLSRDPRADGAIAPCSPAVTLMR